MAKMRRPRQEEELRTLSVDLLAEAEKFFARLSVGTWNPNIDLCATPDSVTVRVELPGVDLDDINLTIQEGVLRIQGIKREPVYSSRLLCYYCLERGYGKFSREISIDWVINAQKARAYMENGILTIDLPKLHERRGSIVIPIIKKN